MKSLGIFDNKHSPHSLPVVQTRKNQYDNSVHNFLAGLKEEKELNDRAAQLQAEYERTLKLENLKIEYGQAAGQLHLWLENANETVKDPISCATVPDAQDLIHNFEQLLAEKPAQESKLASLTSLSTELSSSFGVNSFQPFSPADIQGRWNAFLADADARKQALNSELAKQQHNESLRVQFAEKAKDLKAFVQEHSAFVNSNSTAELEDQLKEIQARKPTIFGGSSKLSDVEGLNTQLSEAGVTHNQHTDLTFHTLRADFQQLVKETNNKETLIQKEIIQKTGSRVSAEQLAEFREVFDHFDKDRRGSLNRLEFKSCLQSLGEDLADAELDKIIGAIGTEGKVPFDSFCDFMANKSADSDSKDQILEAFKLLGGDKGYITEDELRRALPAEKVSYLTSAMPLHNGQAGNYDFVAWANKCFS
jgi:actinin alpha